MKKEPKTVSVSEVEFYEIEDARSYIRDCLGAGSPFFKTEIWETKDGTFVARLYRKPEGV